jgi:hypothetical protein
MPLCPTDPSRAWRLYRGIAMNPDVMGVWVLVAFLGAAWLVLRA